MTTQDTDRDAHEALQPTTDDGEGDAPLMPARPTPPKPRPTLGSGAAELPREPELVGASR